MDWNRAIERNGEALRRILAALVAMAGLSSHLPLVGRSAVVGPPGGGDCAGTTPTRRFASTSPQGGGESGFGPHLRHTLPRHLHRVIATLLRPAESAARRLIIVIARDLVVPPPRPRKPTKKEEMAKAMAEHHAVMRRYGLAVVVPSALAGAMMAKEQAAKPLRIPSLPLLDPLPNLFRRRRKTVPNHRAPRIRSLDWNDPTPPRPLPPPPSPDDPVDATRLRLRLAALSRALDDLPGQARRFARWRAGHAAAHAQGPLPLTRRRSRFARVSPLRPGPAHGWRRPYSRRKPHEIDEVLADLHHFAFHALQRVDTS